MHTSQRKVDTVAKKWNESIGEALMIGGDSISGIYGQRGNTYATYLDAQTKRQALEAEAIKAQQAQSQQSFENQMALHKQAVQESQLGVMNQARQSGIMNSERSVMNQSGFIPSSREQLLGMNPMDRMNALKSRQIGDATGRYFVPKPDSLQQSIDPAVAQKIASYNVDLKTIPGFGKSSVRNAYLKEAVKLNPNFDQKQYEAGKKFMVRLADTKRGTPGAIANSSNTFLSHLNYLDAQVEDLKNGKLPAKNLLINFAKYQLGKSDITNFKQAKEVVDSELETLLTGVGVTQQGLSARRTLLNENSSYQQQKDAIKTLVKIMKARVEPIEAQYKKYGGTDPNGILSPESRSIMDKFGGSKIPEFSPEEEKAYQEWKATQK